MSILNTILAMMSGLGLGVTTVETARVNTPDRAQFDQVESDLNLEIHTEPVFLEARVDWHTEK